MHTHEVIVSFCKHYFQEIKSGVRFSVLTIASPTYLDSLHL